MQIEVTSFIEDYDIINYVSKSEQSAVLTNIFDECCEDSKVEFINYIDNDHLINELKSRGYTITKSVK